MASPPPHHGMAINFFSRFPYRELRVPGDGDGSPLEAGAPQEDLSNQLRVPKRSKVKSVVGIG